MTDNTATQFKRPESVLVVVHTEDDQVLLMRRIKPVFWQSVTGSLLWPDETPRAAAARELEEETGITDTSRLRDWQQSNRFPIRPEWAARYGPDVVENVEHIFSLKLPTPVEVRLNPGEHSEFLWMGIKQASDTVWSWTNRCAIDALK